MIDLLSGFVAAGIGGGITVAAMRHWGGLVNPAALYLGAWTLSLSLFELRLLPYPPLVPEAVLLIGTAGATFIAGVATASLTGWRALADRVGAWFATADITTSRPVMLSIMVTLLALGLLATTLYVVEVVGSLGPLAFVLKLAAVRLLRPDLHYPALLLWGSAIYIWLLAAGLSYRIPTPFYWVGFVAIIPFALTTGRTEPFMVVVIALVAWLLRESHSRQLGTRQVVAIGVSAVLLLGAFLTINALLRKGVADAAIGYGFPRALRSLVDPYLYASAPVAAFNELVRDHTLSGDMSGPLTFWPVHRALFGFGLEGTPASFVAPDVDVPFPVNVYTFLEPYWREYGVAGCVGISWLLGLAGGALHRVAVAGKTALARLPYAIFAFAIVISPFVNHFSPLMVPLLIAFVPLLAGTGVLLSRHLRIAFAR